MPIKKKINYSQIMYYKEIFNYMISDEDTHLRNIT